MPPADDVPGSSHSTSSNCVDVQGAAAGRRPAWSAAAAAATAAAGGQPLCERHQRAAPAPTANVLRPGAARSLSPAAAAATTAGRALSRRSAAGGNAPAAAGGRASYALRPAADARGDDAPAAAVRVRAPALWHARPPAPHGGAYAAPWRQAAAAASWGAQPMSSPRTRRALSVEQSLGATCPAQHISTAAGALNAGLKSETGGLAAQMGSPPMLPPAQGGPPPGWRPPERPRPPGQLPGAPGHFSQGPPLGQGPVHLRPPAMPGPGSSVGAPAFSGEAALPGIA